MSAPDVTTESTKGTEVWEDWTEARIAALRVRHRMVKGDSFYICHFTVDGPEIGSEEPAARIAMPAGRTQLVPGNEQSFRDCSLGDFIAFLNIHRLRLDS